MRLHLRLPLITLAAAFSTNGLHAQPPAAEPEPQASEQFGVFMTQCRARFAEVDARIEQAGLREASYYRIPGFPYLRTERLLSSFRGELDDLNRLGVWMLQLREYDSIARDAELRNLGLAKQERAALLDDLRLCAVWMSYADLADPATSERLFAASAVPDEESSSLPTLKELSTRRAQLRARFTQPLNPRIALTHWQPAASADDSVIPSGFRDVMRDELGRVGLLMSAWPALAARHAPQLLIETQSAQDQLGMPVLLKDGAGVETATPVVYYLPSHARYQGRTLVQISYFLWLPGSLVAGTERPDSLIWRVTLDDDGKPLIYDSVRASGLDHLWFPAQALSVRDARAPESALVPQMEWPAQFALRLQAGTHDLLRLQAADQASTTPARQYELRLYDDLMTLPTPQGGTHSLFDARGTVPGTAPALRQWSHLPTAAGARRHFDDPYLIETLFSAQHESASAR